ncbi:hypothetical protein AB4391_25030 [Vibrio lentus]|uniref:Uncharacterized protein n=1 Tax=Vibrio lentus TaxID=136468 RepID=A0A2N7JYQ0_9VIBR|nr:hypothetical protein [Vibrio lentus]PMM65572.1 hypothetical protein BCT49_13720 [Vibrio lentus]
MLIFIFLSVSSVSGALIAKSKNRNFYLWGAFSFLMPFMIFVLLFLPHGISETEKAKAEIQKNTYIAQYMSNQALYKTNTFLEVVFCSLVEGRTVALDDLLHATNVLERMESAT